MDFLSRFSHIMFVFALASWFTKNLPTLSFEEGYLTLFEDDNFMVLKDEKFVMPLGPTHYVLTKTFFWADISCFVQVIFTYSQVQFFTH